MISGINTDVTRNGHNYHVQTEDLGARNPRILTLVYRNGAIVHRNSVEYAQIIAQDPTGSLTRALMDAQHQEVLRQVLSGEIDGGMCSPEVPLPAEPPKTVEDLIEEYLRSRRRAKADKGGRQEVRQGRDGGLEPAES
jgi:hypothetical protein